MKVLASWPVLGLVMAAVAADWAGAGSRQIPKPLSTHPGNIFLAGEDVVVEARGNDGETWQAVDYEGKRVAEGPIQSGHARLGHLPVGFYQVHALNAPSNAITAGVLETLRAPTSSTSPIATDIAMAWLVPGERMAGLANLCELAGINWVRDRLDWRELEPARGEFVASNRYDYATGIQAGAGLNVLEVSHRSPGWANPNTKRFPIDLRDTYAYHRELARRWKGRVAAFEPWNEADIPDFGGHAGSEMASFQKASWLGLKAGNLQVVACLNVFALHRAEILQDLNENEAWPYFDTFNLHHYESFAAYSKLYADFRAVSAGRPLWVSECSLPVKWKGDEQLQEPSPEDLRVQSERVAVTYALALHERAREVFYFILPHFVEGPTQFGLLRRDLSPRPGFLALAAVGRLLADAQPLGRLRTENSAVEAYLFHAKPDGRAANMLVAWSGSETSFKLPSPPQACWDHLGRPRSIPGDVLPVSHAPVFAKFKPGTAFDLTPPPPPAVFREGKASTIVLQALLPEQSLELARSAFKVSAGEEIEIPIFVYNFGTKKAKGSLLVTSPRGWSAGPLPDIELMPGERKGLKLKVNAGADSSPEAKVRVAGHFKSAGDPVVSFRLMKASP